MTGKLKVLIVDDSAFMRLLISDLLSENAGIDVIGTAVNGLEAKNSAFSSFVERRDVSVGINGHAGEM